MNDKKEQLSALKIHLMGFVTNKINCFYCDEDKIEWLLLHHKSYTNSINYKSFDNSLDGRLEYYSQLLSDVMSYPNNFLVLCYKCHAFRHGKKRMRVWR